MTVSARSPKPVTTIDLDPFKKLLMRTFGHSFEKEREQTLSVGLSCRMVARGITEADAYLSILLHDSAELLRLTELLTVNETYFFREPDHLKLLVDTLLPELLASRKQRPLRIVSAGCSTGEEPYSIAILLRERFGAESEGLFAINGVDIDSTVIAAAQQGVYGKGSFRGMDQALLERYFKPCDQGLFQVNDSIRKQVGFDVVNLLGASYPDSMQLPDIILYRNVSIYFPGQVQREIFAKLSELLTDGGCLIVGASETIYHDLGILSLVKQDSLFFYRKIPSIVIEERRTANRDAYVPKRQSGPLATAPLNAARAGIQRNREQKAPVYEGVRKQTLPDIKERFDAAIELAHNKQHDKALALLDAIIAEESTFEKAYSLKGSLLLSLSRFDEARVICEAILSRDPLCREAYLMLGMIARQKGDDADALKRFREAIYLDAACWLAHFYSAEICYAQQDEKRARSAYEAALRSLETGSLQKHGQDFFPLTFNAEQFSVICRHKLSLLAPLDGARGALNSAVPRSTVATLLKKNG